VNPLRAGLVSRPEDYRWNSLGYHIQTGNKDNFLSLDFGLIEFGLIDAQERLNRYRQYVYETGALNRPDKRQSQVIGRGVLEKERKKIMKSAGQIGSGIAPGIIRIQGLSVPKNLLLRIISGLRAFLCPGGKRSPGGWWAWMGFIC